MKLEKFQNLPRWLKSNVFYRANLSNDSDGPGFEKAHVEVHPLDANLISSQKANGNHTLFLDLDQEHFISESSTTGHSHVYVNTDLSTEALKEIIDILAKHGVVQQGIKKQLDTSGFLTFRPPGVKKGNPYDDSNLNNAKHIEQQSQSDIAGVATKFKALKNQFKSNKKKPFNDLSEAFRVAATAEIAEEIFKDFTSLLNLDSYSFSYESAYSAPWQWKAAEIKYLGHKFCHSSYDTLSDAYIYTFNEKDFSLGQINGLKWEQVKTALKICFGG